HAMIEIPGRVAHATSQGVSGLRRLRGLRRRLTVESDGERGVAGDGLEEARRARAVGSVHDEQAARPRRPGTRLNARLRRDGVNQAVAWTASGRKTRDSTGTREAAASPSTNDSGEKRMMASGSRRRPNGSYQPDYDKTVTPRPGAHVDTNGRAAQMIAADTRRSGRS